MPCPVLKFFLRRSFRFAATWSALAAVAITAVGPPVMATTITFTEAGVSAKGTPLLVSARLDTAGDAGGPNNALKITLRSFGAPTKHAADVLSSFYFNLADPSDNQRPTLTYRSGTAGPAATGQAYEVRSGTDVPVSWSPQTWTTSGTGVSNLSNLVAVNDYDEGWQLKTLNPPPAYPGLGFGIGTVGNSLIWTFIPGGTDGNPEGFDGKVVSGTDPGSMINLGIYSVGDGTDIDPAGALVNTRLVRTEAVFYFTSSKDLNSLTDSWVQGNVTFGFGTGPDTVLLPEPGSLSLAVTGGLLGLGWVGRRRLRCRRPA